MKRNLISFMLLCCAFVSATGTPRNNPAPGNRTPLAAKMLALTAKTPWRAVDSVKLRFNAHHTQGLVKIGDCYYLSAVEVIRWPHNPGGNVSGAERDKGEGKGHIFKFDSEGRLLADLPIGRGHAYHPGGMDYDGRYLWVPVTEYLPHSYSIIYKIDPLTMTATEVFDYDDSIGAIVCNTDDRTLVGMNWDARDFYHWTLDGQGSVTNADVAPKELAVENPSFYVAFQDGQYLGDYLMLGSGLQGFRTPAGDLRLGGWEIFDLRDNRPVRLIPVRIWLPSGGVMTNNPCAVESTPTGLRAYFVPEDDNKATLYIYDIETGPSQGS